MSEWNACAQPPCALAIGHGGTTTSSCRNMYTIGFIWGYSEQKLWITMYCTLGGMLLSCIVCIPDWPFYNKNPLPWYENFRVPSVFAIIYDILASSSRVLFVSCGRQPTLPKPEPEAEKTEQEV